MSHPAPTFSEEQLAYLSSLLSPTCCHTSGTHDPTHFTRNPQAFCGDQKARAWDSAVAALGLEGAIVQAKSHPSCGWCTESREAALKERSVEGLPGVADVLAQCARWSDEREAEDAPEEVMLKGQWRGMRVSVSYARATFIYPRVPCARVVLSLPKFEAEVEIPADGYPVLRGALSEEDRAEFVGMLEKSGATVLDSWGGTEHFGIAMESVHARSEAGVAWNLAP